MEGFLVAQHVRNNSEKKRNLFRVQRKRCWPKVT